MLARLALAAVAVAVLALLASSLREHRVCEQARHDVLAAATGAKPASVQAGAIDDLRDHCRGAQSLVSASAVLLRQGRPAAAQGLAAEAVRAERDNATAWHALAVTAAERDPATARRAAARALALSPLDPPAVDLPGRSSASGAGP